MKLLLSTTDPNPNRNLYHNHRLNQIHPPFEIAGRYLLSMGRTCSQRLESGQYHM